MTLLIGRIYGNTTSLGLCHHFCCSFVDICMCMLCPCVYGYMHQSMCKTQRKILGVLFHHCLSQNLEVDRSAFTNRPRQLKLAWNISVLLLIDPPALNPECWGHRCAVRSIFMSSFFCHKKKRLIMNFQLTYCFIWKPKLSVPIFFRCRSWRIYLLSRTILRPKQLSWRLRSVHSLYFLTSLSR